MLYNILIIYSSNNFLSFSFLFRNVTQAFNLQLGCKDEPKCEKIFNCSTECALIQVKADETHSIKLNALASGHVVLFLANATNDIYLDLSESFVRLSIGQSQILDYLSFICGWIYFVS